MREFQLYGLGNALVDIFIELSETEFASLDFERGSMRLVEPAEQKIGLSLKAVVQDLTEAELRAYMEGQDRDSGTTLGDALRNANLPDGMDFDAAEDDQD